jgi:hypothetical protein
VQSTCETGGLGLGLELSRLNPIGTNPPVGGRDELPRHDERSPDGGDQAPHSKREPLRIEINERIGRSHLARHKRPADSDRSSDFTRYDA